MNEKFKETAPGQVRGQASTRKQYTLTHVHTHTVIYTCPYTYSHMYMHTLSHSCVHIHTHLHTCTRTYTLPHLHSHVHTDMHFHVLTHVCVHTHSHTILTLTQPETQFQDQLLPLCEHCQLGDLFPNLTMKSPLQNHHHSFCCNCLYTLINF